MEFVSIVILNDEIKEKIEDYDPEVLEWMKENGIEDGSRVAWGYYDDEEECTQTIDGNIFVGGEDPFHKPALWLKEESGNITPLYEVDFIVLLKDCGEDK